MALKSLGKLFFVPQIFMLILAPIATYLELLSGSSYPLCYLASYIILQVLCPFFSLWWPLLGFREHIEGGGRETLLAYKKSILRELIEVFIFYFLHFILLLLFYLLCWDFNYFPYLFIFLTQSFAFFSLSLSLAFLLKSISVPFIVGIIYEIFFMGAKAPGLDFINMLSSYPPEDAAGLFLPYVFILSACIIILTLAHLRFRRL